MIFIILTEKEIEIFPSVQAQIHHYYLRQGGYVFAWVRLFVRVWTR